ncbi:DUF4865 family protein [Candidatus Pantoea deserta]|uniref:DUF4865 family protein n=1 Tax=Candidatus Pantoea deserta TaxID=1869313 RepID=A0A3N4P5C8_9GAMM|nr:DUF4865 family protein [Pantoea deserta]RPD99840.1 DUF4865 family protein [Pantoea deserta]
MIAMQYRIILPADYDMDIIERRIRDNAAKLDGFPHLYFKAYLYARRDDGAPANCYAPLYVWQNTAGLTRFLQSAGFARLIADFGWPTITLWLTLTCPEREALIHARFAALHYDAVKPYSDLATLNTDAALTGWDVHHQTLLQADFADDRACLRGDIYRIGYVACGQTLCETR